MKDLNKGMLIYNLKLIPKASLFISILMVFGIQAIFSLKMADFSMMAKIGEFIVSILGIILIPAVAFVDENLDIKEVIYSKAVSPVVPSVIRLVFIIMIMFLEVLTFAKIAVLQGSRFDEFSIVTGVFISAVFLGASGYMIGILSKNIALSYLVSFGYYGFEFTTKGKYTKDLYLFSLQKGYFMVEKWFLLLIAVLFFVISLIYIGNKRAFL